jgi:hypothetical protein
MRTGSLPLAAGLTATHSDVDTSETGQGALVERDRGSNGGAEHGEDREESELHSECD